MPNSCTLEFLKKKHNNKSVMLWCDLELPFFSHLVLGGGRGADCCGAAGERGGIGGCTGLLRGLW